MSKRARNIQIMKRGSGNGGVSFQIPKDWDDGSGKVRHIQSGPMKGRVYWTNRSEAREIAKRLQDKEERFVRYDS